MKKLIAIFLFSLLATGLTAQEIQPVISTDRDSILIGDQINLNIRVSANSGTKIAWPRLEEFLVPKVEIISKSAIDSSINENNELLLEQKLVITSFDSGYYQIPGLEFTYQKPGDESFLKSTSNSLGLYVNTLAVDTTKAIKPIKGPISSPYTWKEIAPWLILGVVVIGMVIFLIYYFRKKEKKEPVFNIKPKAKIAPHIVALSGLENLKGKGLWQDGKFKQYYTELIDIIRVYLDDQFGIDAMEMTSEEINQMVAKESIINEAIRQKLAETLNISDLVKFAKEKPYADINNQSLENLILFVNQTHKLKQQLQAENEKTEEKKEEETSTTEINKTK